MGRACFRLLLLLRTAVFSTECTVPASGDSDMRTICWRTCLYSIYILCYNIQHLFLAFDQESDSDVPVPSP